MKIFELIGGKVRERQDGTANLSLDEIAEETAKSDVSQTEEQKKEETPKQENRPKMECGPNGCHVTYSEHNDEQTAKADKIEGALAAEKDYSEELAGLKSDIAALTATVAGIKQALDKNYSVWEETAKMALGTDAAPNYGCESNAEVSYEDAVSKALENMRKY